MAIEHTIQTNNIMTGYNTTATEDRILSQCEDFGGLAETASEITARLDMVITIQAEEMTDLEVKLNAALNELAAIEEDVNHS